MRARDYPWRLGLALGYVTLLFVFGSLPSSGGPQSLNDKALHFAAFGLQTWVTFPLTHALEPQRLRRSLGQAIAVSVLSGALLELWQAPLPTRDADWLDLAADALGAFVFGGLLWGGLWLARQYRRLREVR